MAEVSSGTRDGLTSVTRGTLVMMIGTLGFVAETFVTRVLLYRILSIDEVSQFFLGLIIAGLLSSIGTLGLPQAIARSLPFEADQRERRRMVRTAFAYVVPSAVAIAGDMGILSIPIATTYRSPLLAETLVFFAVAVALQIVGTLIAAIFQGYEDVLPNAIFIQVLNPLLFIAFFVVAVGLAPVRLAYPTALGAYLLAAVLTIVSLAEYSRRRLPKHLIPGPRFPGSSTKLLTFALPLFVVTALGFVAGNIDTIILGVVNRSTVAYYSVDLSLARLLQVGIGSLSYIILPVTARFVRLGDKESVRTTYSTATKWTLLTAVPLFLVFFFDPVGSLTFVYGPGSAVDALGLQILLIGALVSTLVGPATATQVSFGQTRLLLYNTVISAAADVVLSLALIPAWGVTGAAIAWTVSIASYPILSLVEIALLEGVHPFQRHFLMPLLLTTVPIGFLLAVLPFPLPLWSLPALVIAIAGAFVLLVLATGSLDAGDRLLLEAIERLLGRRLEWLRALGRRFMPRENRGPGGA
ncbi:MAG: oligosaccharide flippase family protein [Thermoplasmata archaeon]|nr:oligosaccharide flippase family protein [Thermoplasmata archaeon]